MKKINVLKICYWCLLSISALMMVLRFPIRTLKDFLTLIIIVTCAIAAGYVNRMIDEEKEK